MTHKNMFNSVLIIMALLTLLIVNPAFAEAEKIIIEFLDQSEN